MPKTNLVVIGGFLGAGKTTSILNMAKYLLQQGKKVGIVTNDQGSQLVDTQFLIQAGLPVLEVTGGCFCCNFDQFTAKVNQLAQHEMPDLILAEPVGSCTDLIATIFKPLQLNYTKQFNLSPLSIVVDPGRVKKLMLESKLSPFPNEINYLFQKQLEEADLIVLNKIDLFPESEISLLSAFLKQKFKGRDLLAISAKNDLGISEWADLVTNQQANPARRTLDIEYSTYAAAEAYLGWLNSSALFTADYAIDYNRIIQELMENIKENLKNTGHEIAHLKIYGISEKDWVKASLTSVFDTTDFSRRMEKETYQANVIINARINIDPLILKPLIEEALSAAARKNRITITDLKTECFKPAKPEPKYRIIS